MIDEALARRAAAGDAAAFAALVRMHEARVRRFLRRLVRGEGADDIAQEVFLKAWQSRARWRGEGAYGAWLMQIAWTSFIGSYRADHRRAARDHGGYEAADPVPVRSPDLKLDVERALAALDDRERAAVQLCLVEGFSHGDAARIMAIPPGTLKSIVARAKSRLADLLEVQDDR